LFEAAVLLSDLADAILYLAESCESEIDTLCADVAMGEGRILACLDESRARLGNVCASALDETTEE